MSYRAYDFNQVVHLTPYKGASLPLCFAADEADHTQEAPLMSPMFLSVDTPLSCVKCIAIEASSANEANEANEDDED